MTTHSLDPYTSIPLQRKAVALYIAGLAADIRQTIAPAADCNPTPLPEFITGVRRKYLLALQTHVLAKRALAGEDKESATSADGSVSTAVASDSGNDIILNRLNRSRQLQHHVSLDTLSRHVTAFEELLPNSCHPDVDRHESGNAITVPATPDNLKHLRGGSSEELLRKLEMAVFNARIRSEQGRVGDSFPDKTRSAVTQPQNITNKSAVSRLRALRAVHVKLTAWIEESLAVCAQQEPSVDDDLVVNQEDHNQDQADSELEAAYSRYVVERKSMTAAVDALRQPLPHISMEATVPKTHGTREVLVPSNSAKEADAAADVQRRVCLYQESQRSKLIAEYARAELEKESDETAAMLDRLADESQLLPAYPRLVKVPHSERRQMAASEPATAQAAIPPSETTVKTRIDAWSFASGAADVSVGTAIDRDLADGNKAIDAAMKSLQDLSLLREFISRQ